MRLLPKVALLCAIPGTSSAANLRASKSILSKSETAPVEVDKPCQGNPQDSI